jgi:hypothetical protein
MSRTGLLMSHGGDIWVWRSRQSIDFGRFENEQGDSARRWIGNRGVGSVWDRYGSLKLESRVKKAWLGDDDSIYEIWCEKRPGWAFGVRWLRWR